MWHQDPAHWSISLWRYNILEVWTSEHLWRINSGGFQCKSRGPTQSYWVEFSLSESAYNLSCVISHPWLGCLTPSLQDQTGSISAFAGWMLTIAATEDCYCKTGICKWVKVTVSLGICLRIDTYLLNSYICFSIYHNPIEFFSISWKHKIYFLSLMYLFILYFCQISSPSSCYIPDPLLPFTYTLNSLLLHFRLGRRTGLTSIKHAISNCLRIKHLPFF